MLDRALHATLVPGDPPRRTALALWHPDGPGASPSATSTTAEQELVTLVLPSAAGPAATTLRADLVPVAELLDELVDVAPDDPAASPSVRAWGVVARHALGLMARGRLEPAITASGLDCWTLAPLD